MNPNKLSFEARQAALAEAEAANPTPPTVDPSWQEPLVISPQVALNSRVFLAPMAGVTDVVFRSLVRQTSPTAMICTEMISSNGLVYSKQWSAKILDSSLEEHPIAYQLAANKIDVLVEAATGILERYRPETLDLNMGCPVKKITGNFEGCALMKDLDHAHKLISTLVAAVDVPVTLKCRLGWDDANQNFAAFGQMAESAGAKLITLHGRTRAQGYKPGVNQAAWGQLKQAVSIPVIANGDIVTPHQAAHIMATYGVDGVMIGRGCQGEPWRIGLIDHYLKTGELLPEPTLSQRLDYAWQHVTQMVAYKGEQWGIREMRGQLPWYVKGFAGASRFRAQLTQVNTLLEVEAVLEAIRTSSSMIEDARHLPVAV
jgi:tRNA-dihydrouridine synthase B